MDWNSIRLAQVPRAVLLHSTRQCCSHPRPWGSGRRGVHDVGYWVALGPQVVCDPGAADQSCEVLCNTNIAITRVIGKTCDKFSRVQQQHVVIVYPTLLPTPSHLVEN